MSSFLEKSALVFGSTSGIGKVVERRFAEKGACVVIFSQCAGSRRNDRISARWCLPYWSRVLITE